MNKETKRQRDIFSQIQNFTVQTNPMHSVVEKIDFHLNNPGAFKEKKQFRRIGIPVSELCPKYTSSLK